MPIFITDESALDFWNHLRSKGSIYVMPKTSRIKRITDGAPTPAEVIAALEGIMPTRKPISVMISSNKDHRRSEEVSYYAFSRKLPYGSFARIDDGLYVATPEFAFVRMARKIGLFELIYLGCELAGAYTRPFDKSEFDTSGFHPCEARTSQASLKRFVASAGNIHGIKAARRAVEHIVDGAASPMEAELAITLTLPFRYGGYALPTPHLNYELPMSFEASLRIKRNSIFVDAAWPHKKVVLEYDSDMWHTGAEKIAKDSIRRNDIALLGYTVKTITRKEISNISSMDKIAESLSKALGIRMRQKPSDYANRKIKLQRALVGFRNQT